MASTSDNFRAVSAEVGSTHRLPDGTPGLSTTEVSLVTGRCRNRAGRLLCRGDLGTPNGKNRLMKIMLRYHNNCAVRWKYLDDHLCDLVQRPISSPCSVASRVLKAAECMATTWVLLCDRQHHASTPDHTSPVPILGGELSQPKGQRECRGAGQSGLARLQTAGTSSGNQPQAGPSAFEWCHSDLKRPYWARSGHLDQRPPRNVCFSLASERKTDPPEPRSILSTVRPQQNQESQCDDPASLMPPAALGPH